MDIRSEPALHHEKDCDSPSNLVTLPTNEQSLTHFQLFFPGPCRNFYFIMIPSHDRKSVLVQTLPNACIQLPVLETSLDFLNMSMTSLEELITYVFSIQVRFVRELWRADEDRDVVLWGKTYDTVAVLLFEWGEAESTISTSITTKWISRSAVHDANWVRAERALELDLKQTVCECMKEINEETHLRIPPWRHMGWRTKMMKWVKQILELEYVDDELYKKFYKIRDHHHSVVWKCELDISGGDQTNDSEDVFYIKAALPPLAEAERTAVIARVLGNIVPEIIAVHESDCILLMRDAGFFDQEEESLDGKVFVNTIRNMQLKSMNHLDELKAGGVEVRDSKWVVSNIHRILFHKSLKKAVKGNTVMEGMLQEIQSREKEVIDACNKISKYNIPNVLVHGDLGHDNIAMPTKLRGEQYQFYDWDFSFIGHPFLDVKAVRGFFQDKSRRIHCLREYWKYWSSTVSEEEFLLLLELVGVQESVSSLGIFVKESERYEHGYGLTWRLRELIELFKSELDHIKNYNGNK